MYTPETIVEPTVAVAGEPLLTAGGLWAFVSKSVILTRDLGWFCQSSVSSIVWEYIPPNVQGQIVDQYGELTGAVNAFRVKHGIPAPDQLVSDAQTEYFAKVHPHVESGMEKGASFVSAKLTDFHLVREFVESFEAAYPEHEGSISKSLLDLVVLIVFLYYFVLRFACKALCYVFCCGACSKRREVVKGSGMPSIQKKNSAPPAKKTR